MYDFDTKLKLRYLLSDLKILTQKNPGWSVRNELTQLILVDLVEDEDRPRTDPSTLTMRSKENKDYHSSDRSIITFLLYIGFGNRINLFKYF
jgi:hypothetical protein